MTIHVDYSSNPTKFFGLSTDVKPTRQDVGDLFYETDTCIWYVYTNESGGWIAQDSFMDNIYNY